MIDLYGLRGHPFVSAIVVGAELGTHHRGYLVDMRQHFAEISIIQEQAVIGRDITEGSLLFYLQTVANINRLPVEFATEGEDGEDDCDDCDDEEAFPCDLSPPVL